MTIGITGTTATISGTSVGSPQSIESIIDAFAAVSSTYAGRTNTQGWIGAGCAVVMSASTDAVQISTRFKHEWRANAYIKLSVGTLILKELSVVHYTGTNELGPSGPTYANNDPTRLTTSSGLICYRYNGINPVVIIEAGANVGSPGRSDIFTCPDTTVGPVVNIQGLDLYFVPGTYGYIKVYYNSASTLNNIRFFGDARLQLFGDSVRANAPVFNNLYAESMNIAGDFGSGGAFVPGGPNIYGATTYTRLVKPTFNDSTNSYLGGAYRQSYVILEDPIFQANSPAGITADDLKDGGCQIFYTETATTKQGSTPIQNTNAQFIPNSGTTITVASDVAGSFGAQKLLTKQYVGSGTVVYNGNQPFTSYTWSMKERDYSRSTPSEYVFQNRAYTAPQTEEIQVLPVLTSVTEATAGEPRTRDTRAPSVFNDERRKS